MGKAMLDLIAHALQYAREARTKELEVNGAINEPLTPTARRAHVYLRIKENLAVGARKSVKLVTVNWKRSIAFSILMEALNDIFHYGMQQSLLDYYNAKLLDMVGDY